MSNKVYKNYQINLGLPFQVKVPLEEILMNFGESATDLDTDDRFDSSGEEASGRYGNLSMRSSIFKADGADKNLDGRDVFDGDVLFSGFDTDNAGSEAEIEDLARAEAEKIIGEAREKGAEIITDANSRARTIIDEARHEADAYYNKIHEQAEAEAVELRESARCEGESLGRSEGKAAYDSLIAEAGRIRDDAEVEYARLLADAEGDALELILGIAKKVIGDEIEYKREKLICMIKDAFFHCTNRNEIILKVASADYDYVLENKDLLLSSVEGIDKFEIRRDLALEPGACLIETPFGNLDAGVSTRFSKIEDAFYHILAANRPLTNDLIA